MIRVTIYQHSLISGFKIVGHAGAAQYGHDVVCAAVSVLSINTVNSISSLARIHPWIKRDSVNGGLLMMKVPQINHQVQSLKVQTLLRSFELGIRSIVRRYSRYVRLKIERS